MSNFLNDTFTLVIFIILVILLILIGKYTGLVLYRVYRSIDKGSYKPNKWDVEQELCPESNSSCGGFRLSNTSDDTKKCTYTPEQYKEAEENVSIRKAEDNGRDVGGWMGFLLGFLLLANKTYDIYKKSQTKTD